MNVYNTKRIWKLLTSLLFITILIFLLQNPLTYKQAEQATTVSEQIMIKPNNAFVTFLCDDIMGEATQVLVHSLKKTKTRRDIVVLVLDNVTSLTRNKLEYLGAKIILVDQIKYPWDSNSARRKGFNKACRYSKLNLWSLTQYEKVVFLDADTMVINSIDELFEYPQFSAVVDIGGVVNTGVFVAEPNTATYHDIMRIYENAPSYNRGDQGFLNYYFNQSINPLPGNYNLMVKFTHFSALAVSFISKNTVKVLHFTSETKPWNFYFLHQREWRENYDGYLFGLWTRSLREMQSQLITGGLLEPTGTTQDTTWPNQDRVKQICDHSLRKTFGRRYPKTEQMTIILNLNKIDITQSQLDKLLETYASSKKVSRIFIQGNLVKDKEGKRVVLKSTYLRNLHLHKPVKFVPRVTFESINNKFNPIQGVVTTCVFMVDGNIPISLPDLEFGYQVWKKNQDALIGFISNSHGLDTTTQELSLTPKIEKSYNMVSSQAMFMKSDFLYAYTCLLPENIHQYIDLHPICHNTVINMLVSGVTGSSPILVNTSLISQFRHTEESQCLSDLKRYFNGQNTLVFTDQIVTRVS